MVIYSFNIVVPIYFNSIAISPPISTIYYENYSGAYQVAFWADGVLTTLYCYKSVPYEAVVATPVPSGPYTLVQT